MENHKCWGVALCNNKADITAADNEVNGSAGETPMWIPWAN